MGHMFLFLEQSALCQTYDLTYVLTYQGNNNKKAAATIYFNSFISQDKLLVLSVKMYNTPTAVTLFHRTAKQLDKTVSI